MTAVRHQSLARRLIKAIALWGLLFGGVWAVAMGLWARRDAEQRLQAALTRYVESMAGNIAETLWQVSPDLAQGHLDTAMGISGVGYLVVRERGGVRPFATAGQAALAKGVEPLVFPIRTGPDPRPDLRFTTSGQPAPPRDVGRVLGELQVFPDPVALRREAASQVLRALLPGLALTALLLGMALVLVHRRVHRPLAALSACLDGLRADEPGPAWKPPPGRVPDELDRVADSLAGLQQRVVEHVQQLDARVAERTEQLQTALDTLRTLAVTDPLTACSNRLAFSQKYPEAIAHAERYGRPLAVVFCDVDRFKFINDNHGHPVGDQVLAAMGCCLRGALRASSDWVARYGGEEFVLVLPETSLAQAQELAERLREQIEQTVRVELPGGGALGATASLGVAEYRCGERGEDLLGRADEQLYLAKQAGRNQVQPPVAVSV